MKITNAKKKMKTELQWNQLGYVLNKDAKGEYQAVNGWHQNYCMRYTEEEVHVDKVKAKEIIKAKNLQYCENAKKKKEDWKWFDEFRDNMKTYYQWIQEGRIPNKDAKWDSGKHLNYLYKHICDYSFGNDYWYCHYKDTHEPQDNEELEREKEELNEIYYQQNHNTNIKNEGIEVESSDKEDLK